MGKPHPHSVRARNINALTAFRQHWKQSPEYPEENHGSNYITMLADIRYEWRNGKSVGAFQSGIRISVHPGDDGNIEVSPTGKYTTARYHLGYSPDFQTYRFDETEHALVVEGSSDKMKGEYRVTIVPAITRP